MQPVLIGLCCHDHFSIVPPLCVPIQGGARLNPPVVGALPDVGPGGDISAKNNTYCELTVLYYLWKNFTAEYCGLCHYRRFICFNETISRRYLALKRPTQKQRERYFGSESGIKDLLCECDVLLPFPEDMGVSAMEHYRTSKHHKGEDMDLFLEVLSEMHPQLVGAAREYLSQNKLYFCNIFIMRYALFDEYCRLLFSTLSEFDRRKEVEGDKPTDRTDGYLGERFLGIYITFLRKKGKQIKETSRIDIECSLQKRLLYFLFPPESRRRFLTKKVAKHLL